MAVLERLIAVIAPHNCLVCEQEGDLICAGCLGRLRRTRRQVCFACNRLSPGGRTCLNCRRKYHLLGVTVAAYYNEEMRQFVAAVKYQGAASQAKLAAKLLAPLIVPDQFDLITWVPTTPRRARGRGYNQAKLIAKALAQELNLDYAGVLSRYQGKSQVGQSRQTRLEQVRDQFYSVRPKLASDARVLLVDDVITTGATMSECAKTLKLAGAKSVWAAAAAKH